MPLARRVQLLERAAARGMWVIEDDYDSEYRYAGRLLAALQGLAPGHVVFTGSFSKVLFPSLRVGYMVVPPALRDPILALRQHIDGGPSSHAQAVVADFMVHGHFERHVRRMRGAYRERQAAFFASLAPEARECLRAEPADAGMHLVAWLDAHLDDRVVAARAAEAQVHTQPLSVFTLEHRRPPALLLGYASTPPAHMPRAVRTLLECLDADK